MPSNRELPWPKLVNSPVLDSVRPVIEHSRDVQTSAAKIREVASWMAYEELPIPDYALPFGIGEGDVNQTIDFILTTSCIDTAFTDFSTQIKFQADYGGRSWSDSDALFACMKRALDSGVPILEGQFLARVTLAEMKTLFAGNIELPMLQEKMEILHEVGLVLTEHYNGRFHKFVASCAPRLYDHGNGLVERLVSEFPRFRDISLYDGHTIKFYKLPQLAIWFLYTSLRKTGKLHLEDLEKMSAFADYIVPVALRLLGITAYSSELEIAINSHQMIPRDSSWEIEIRSHCIYASAFLAETINRLRPPDRQIIVPQIDARLWTHYHTTWWPHHLTKTIMY
jgi:Potential Queuosine, Q, salvage protein family